MAAFGPKLESIARSVCLYLTLEVDNLHSTSRKKSLVYAKHLVCYFARKYTVLSLSEIGNYFWEGYNHATVIHGIRKIEEMLTYDNRVMADVHGIDDCIEDNNEALMEILEKSPVGIAAHIKSVPLKEGERIIRALLFKVG